METRVDSTRPEPAAALDLLDAVLAASPGGLVILRPDLRVHAMNASAARLLNLASDANGLAWGDLARPLSPAIDPVERALNANQTGCHEGRFESVGSRRQFDVRVTTHRRLGRAEALVLTLSAAEFDPDRARWFERAIRELPTAIYVIDPRTGILVYINDLMREFAGNRLIVGATGAERVQSLDIRDAGTGQRLAYDEYPSVRAARGEVVRDYPMTWITERGPRDVAVTAHLVPGGPVDDRELVIVSVTDQTKLKDVQRRLEESEARLRVALASADVGTWLVDLASGLVTVSASTALIFDYPVTTAPLFDVIGARVHPDDVGRVRTKWFAAMAAGEAYIDEYRVRRRDGSIRWVYSRGRAVAGVEPGAISGVLADITDNKLAELNLRLERQKMTAVFDESPAAIALWRGADIIFERVNPRFCALFAARELVGKSLAEALPDLIAQPFFAAPAHVFATGRSIVAREAPIFTEPGAAVRHFDYAFVRINDPDGTPYGVFGHAADVTDRVRAREQLERAKVAAETANQAKSAFLANISHEIRTPLGAILGFAELAEDAEVPVESRRQYLRTITRNGRALTRIIDDLLDLAKVEAGQLDVELIDVDLAGVVDEVIDLFTEVARAKGLYLRTNLALNLPPRVRTDPTRLRQILINVVGNAIKFTERGGVSLEAQLGADPADPRIEIRVRDTGVGLSADQRQRLFRPFAQADESTTRRFGGTGLGLALARRLAFALGGDVVVEWSEPGRGSVFRVTLSAGESPRL